MELTGKAKEQFEKWYSDTVISQHKDYYTDMDYFTPSMRYGVYVDFFDSVGITITIDPNWDYDVFGKGSGMITYQYYVYFEQETAKCEEFKTRPEARTAAITKADEILNEQNKQIMEEEKDIIDEYYEFWNDKKKFPKAKEKAFMIWSDLNGRIGVGFDDVDHEIQCEVLESWVEIIQGAKRNIKRTIK
jgi:hypothetical protein